MNIYSQGDNSVATVHISPSTDEVYTPFLNNTNDMAITKDNIQEYTKQLDLQTNTHQVSLFLFNKYYLLINNLHN